MNYFIKGKTNAKAEAINSKIQRSIAANYGVRDRDFFMYRLAAITPSTSWRKSTLWDDVI